MNNPILVVDVSRYQETIDCEVLKQNGVKVVIIKSSGGLTEDCKLREHAAKVGSDLVLGVYHWVDPTVDITKQADFCVGLAKQVGADFIAADIEQYWSNWGTWYQAIQNRIKWKLVKAFAGPKLSGDYQQFYRLVSVEYPTMVYTSPGFVSTHAPQMKTWLPGVPLWTAQYQTYAGQGTPWECMTEYILPQVAKRTPALPTGSSMSDCVMWQFTGDKYALEGTYADKNRKHPSNIDLSVLLWSWDQFTNWLSGKPVPINNDPEPIDNDLDPITQPEVIIPAGYRLVWNRKQGRYVLKRQG